MGLFDSFVKEPQVAPNLGLHTSPEIQPGDKYYNPMQEKNPVNPLTQNDSVQEAVDYYGRGQVAINTSQAEQPEELYNTDTGEITDLVTAPQAVTPQGDDVPMTPVINDSRAPSQPGMLDDNFTGTVISGQSSGASTGTAVKDKMSGEEAHEIEEPGFLKQYRKQAEARVQADIDQREAYIRSITPGMFQRRFDPMRAYAGMIYNQVCHDGSPDTQAALSLYQTAVAQYGHSIVKLRTSYEQSTAIKAAVDAEIQSNLARASQQYFGAGLGSWQSHAADEVVDTSEHTRQGIAFLSASDKDRAAILQKNMEVQQKNVDEMLKKLEKAPDRMKTRITSGTAQNIHGAIMAGSIDLNQGVGMLSDMALNDKLWSAADLHYANALEQQYGMNHDAARRMMVGMRIPAVREHITNLVNFNEDPQRDPMSKRKAMAFCSAVFNSRDLAAAWRLLGSRDAVENKYKAELLSGTALAFSRLQNDNLRQSILDADAKNSMVAAATAYTANMQTIDPVTGQPAFFDNSDMQANAAEVLSDTVERLQKSTAASDRVIGQYYQAGFDSIKNVDAVQVLQEGGNSLPPGQAAIMRPMVERLQTEANRVMAGIQESSPELMKELQKAVTVISKGEKLDGQVARHLSVQLGVSDVSTIANAIQGYKQANAITDRELSKSMVTAAMVDYVVRDASKVVRTIRVDNTFLADQMAKGYIKQIGPGVYQQTYSKNAIGYELVRSDDGRYGVKFNAVQAATAEITRRCTELVHQYMATPKLDGTYPSAYELNMDQLRSEVAAQLAASPASIAMFKLALNQAGVENIITSGLNAAINNAKQIVGTAVPVGGN